MRIAFVGKGGSGKTTMSALFAAYLAQKGEDVLAIDADLNMHLAELLGFEALPAEKHISHPSAVQVIHPHLRGSNAHLADISHFRKSTPPGIGSNLIKLGEESDLILQEFTARNANLSLMVVGTYDEKGIGASCYHNNLGILENVLSHLVDEKGVVVADMVAGIDAFSGTLHAQFDLLVMVVEPTRHSLEVFEQYQDLAREAGVDKALVVMGNKVATAEDEAYIREHVPADKLLGFFKRSDYLLKKEREGGAFDMTQLEKENATLLGTIEERLEASIVEPDTRLQKLYELHKRYVGQASVAERFGDLTSQIDQNFSYRRG